MALRGVGLPPVVSQRGQITRGLDSSYKELRRKLRRHVSGARCVGGAIASEVQNRGMPAQGCADRPMMAISQRLAAELDREVRAEEDRTGIRDPQHFAYLVAKSAGLRRDNPPAFDRAASASVDSANAALKTASSVTTSRRTQRSSDDEPRRSRPLTTQRNGTRNENVVRAKSCIRPLAVGWVACRGGACPPVGGRCTARQRVGAERRHPMCVAKAFAERSQSRSRALRARDFQIWLLIQRGVGPATCRSPAAPPAALRPHRRLLPPPRRTRLRLARRRCPPVQQPVREASAHQAFSREHWEVRRLHLHGRGGPSAEILLPPAAEAEAAGVQPYRLWKAARRIKGSQAPYTATAAAVPDVPIRVDGSIRDNCRLELQGQKPRVDGRASSAAKCPAFSSGPIHGALPTGRLRRSRVVRTQPNSKQHPQRRRPSASLRPRDVGEVVLAAASKVSLTNGPAPETAVNFLRAERCRASPGRAVAQRWRSDRRDDDAWPRCEGRLHLVRPHVRPRALGAGAAVFLFSGARNRLRLRTVRRCRIGRCRRTADFSVCSIKAGRAGACAPPRHFGAILMNALLLHSATVVVAPDCRRGGELLNDFRAWSLQFALCTTSVVQCTVSPRTGAEISRRSCRGWRWRCRWSCRTPGCRSSGRA